MVSMQISEMYTIYAVKGRRIKCKRYAEIGPRVTHVNTLSIITPQNIVPDVRNESKKQSHIVFIYAWL